MTNHDWHLNKILLTAPVTYIRSQFQISSINFNSSDLKIKYTLFLLDLVALKSKNKLSIFFSAHPNDRHDISKAMKNIASISVSRSNGIILCIFLVIIVICVYTYWRCVAATNIWHTHTHQFDTGLCVQCPCVYKTKKISLLVLVLVCVEWLFSFHQSIKYIRA